MKKAFGLVCALLLVSLFLPGPGALPTYAGTNYVVSSLADDTNSDGQCTLREAILAANNDLSYNGDCGQPSGGDDTITFSVSGTITLTSTLPAIVSGQGKLTIDGGGNITINANAKRAMYVNNGADLTVKNITIKDGYVYNGNGAAIYNDGGTLTVINSTFSRNYIDGNGVHVRGGAIYNNNGTLAVINSTFSGSVALSWAASALGGAIYSENGTVTVTNSTFSDNFGVTAMTDSGGAIYIYSGTLTVTNSTFTNNNSTYAGGAIYSNGTLTVTNSTFSGNRSGRGGAIFNNGAAIITDSTFSNNTTSTYGDGGAIRSFGMLTVTNSTFSGNQADWDGGAIKGGVTVSKSTFVSNSGRMGGAIYGGGTIINSTFFSNSATYQGGGLYGSGTVINSTFSGNSAANSGGGIYVSGWLAPTLKNAIIADNTGGDCVGTADTSSSKNNLIKDSANACGLTNGVNGNIIGVDPMLGTVTGSPAYFPLLAGSPAIDAGDDATCADPATVNNQSQNGVTRPQGPHCDIGSYEAPQAAPPPAAPQNVAATPGDGQVTLTWGAVQGATSYNIYMATQSGVTKANWQTKPGGMRHTGITGTSYTHTGLQNGTTYYFVVTAVNAAGESAESAEVSATPQASGGGTSGTVNTPGGQVQVGLQGGTFTQSPMAQSVTPPQGWQAPYGGITFTAQVSQPGGILTVTLTFPQPIPQGAQLWKFVNNQWQAVPNAQLSGNTATFQVQDGGSLDADGQANGQVTDPVALLVPGPGLGSYRLFLPFTSRQ